MANPNKHVCKLQEFSAHNANVSCLALGQKSGGRVLATGGADNKINLWAVGNENCILSLSGHVTPIECVQFDHSEELVGAGSQTGALKIWDLAAQKILRTFSGHKSAVKELDFYPLGNYVVSGSADTSIKLWDYRHKNCIYMYKGHEGPLSCLKFSPDGQWIASAGEDGGIKIWDLRVGRMLHEFDKLHKATVTSIQFHPLVFLLATSGADKKINILDLERFSVVSQIETEKSTIRCLQFSAKGDVVYGGGTNYLGVYGWEPTRTCDSLTLDWGSVNELAVTDNQIVGATHYSTNVSTWVINLPEGYPFKNQFSPPDKSLKASNTMFTRDAGVRKSFNKQKTREIIKPKPNMKLIDESETEIEEDNQGVINNVIDYHSVFKPNRTLNRSPTPKSPMSEDDNLSPILKNPPIDLNKINSVNKYSPSLDDLSKEDEQKHTFDIPQAVLMHTSYSEAETSSMESTPYESFHMAHSDRDINSSGIISDYHSPHSLYNSPSMVEHSDPRINPYMTSSVSMRSVTAANIASESITRRPSSLPVFKQNDNFVYGNKYTSPQLQRKISQDETTSPHISHHRRMLPAEPTVVTQEHKKTDRLTKKYSYPLDDFEDLKDNLNTITDESDILDYLSKNHRSTMGVLKERQRNLNIIQTMWINKNFKSAVNSAVSMNDDALIADLISVLTQRPKLWCLDVCSMLLPSISDLIQSGNEAFINVSFKAIRDILQYFMPVIKNNIHRPSGIGVDLMQEERCNKCRKCHGILMNIRAFVLKRQTVQGNLGHMFRQLHMLLQSIDI
ncbi:katanin p80 WD40 repeat-containing subunit B1 [Adelges cooleyi]|uniref:katanin p80 WD40 repeat-containing subunit B1 n=1 Tax=Adelges cooleyi TaxID=133065 RepID=UPI00218003FB|nr:katanin p80 WD40 repeat-containing subunit B1 [Adelges cooleyi]XP_050430948.1 katanin p80 WD40 repeat-containing subunit B1 [Adelges cooleyi]